MNKEDKNFFTPFENAPHEALPKSSDILSKDTEDKLITSQTNRNIQNQILNPETIKINDENKINVNLPEPNLEITMNHPNSLNNDFRETAHELNQRPVNDDNNDNNVDQHQLEVINIDDQRTQITSENLNTEEELKKSRSILQSCLVILSNCLIISVIFFLYFEIEFGKEILFILTTTFQIMSVILSVVNKGKQNKKFFLIERMNIFLVSMLIYLKIELNTFKLIYCLITIPIVHLVYWIKNSKDKHSYISANFAVRMLFFLQTLQIALRVDNYISWDWNLVFWIFWMIAIMSIFYVMGLSILLVLTLYYKYFGQAENFQIIGLIWCFSNISNFVVGICLILKGIINCLIRDEIDIMRHSLLITQFWIFFNIMYSYFLRVEIIKFINVLLYDRDGTDTETDLNQMESGKKQKVIYNIETVDNLPDDMPRFLMKFSSTYFQNSEITKDFLNKLVGGKKGSRKKKNSKVKQSLKKFEKKSCENEMESANLAGADKHDNFKKEKKTSLSDENEPKKSGTREKSEPEKTNEKDTKNESMLNQSVLNQSENNGENNQSVLNQSHNMSLNQSLNQSVASCLICYEKLPDAVLMECGHGGLCYDCAVDIWKKNGECYLCRKEIVKIYQIDLKGGMGKYKQIIKLSNLKKEIIEESVLENEQEEGENQENPDNSQQEGQEYHDDDQENISHNLSNVEVDNQILRYLEQQQQN